MIVKENGLRYAKLIHVSVDNGQTKNSNKVYIMEEMPDNTIKCQYGRVGESLAVDIKPSHKWDSVLKQKTSKSKNYTDVTELLVEEENTVEDNTPKEDRIEIIKDEVVKKLIKELMAFANKSIQKNYKVTQESVSEQQITSAQEVLDTISGLIAIGVDVKHINDMLMKLYTIIPRKMGNVKDYLIEKLDDNQSLNVVKDFINGEQSTLDTMAGQVKLIKQQKASSKPVSLDSDNPTPKEQISLLEQMGLEVSVETDKETLTLINKLMGDNVSQLKKVYKVVNKKTQEIFETQYKNATNKKRRLYWHGSRNENWFNIIQTGLMIRPSGAVHTGSMFGDGIYAADRSQKSIGYTSLRGSYWAKGGDNKAFLALFDFHLGNQKHIYKHDSTCYKLNHKDLKKEGFDSVHAHGGADLRNDEFIVYNSSQCTISHLIEIS